MSIIKSSTDPGAGRLGSLHLSNIPFNVKRIYWVTDFVPGVKRGNHAHKTLKQVMFSVRGEIKVSLRVGTVESFYKLDPNSNPLQVPPGVWRVFESLSNDSVLMVIASQEYDESDYIRNYQEYLEWFRGQI